MNTALNRLKTAFQPATAAIPIKEAASHLRITREEMSQLFADDLGYR